MLNMRQYSRTAIAKPLLLMHRMCSCVVANTSDSAKARAQDSGRAR